jgi:probable DNA repair protein
MTPTDAAGSSFDALVFLRATDANWPPPERANPLLGWPLQQDRQMPGTDPAQASARADRLTTRLIASAPTVLFSYAAEDETGPQRLSPLIARLDWPQHTADDVSAPASTITLEEFEDTAPLPALTSTSVRGGAVVLKLQAACGFRAFAEMRLNANAPETTSPGFDPRQTGNFIHNIMDSFWREIQTQANLRAMSEPDRAHKLNTAIDQSFSRKLSPEGPWEHAYVAVQKERLRSVLLKWLDLELQRSPFTVTAREQQKHIQIGPLTLSLRMDRVDQLEGGGTLLIDYKTGSRSTPHDWEGERPDDPQLPLYALLPEAENLQGLAFAKIRPGSMKWLGYGPIPRPSAMEHATIDEQIEAWRFVLENLAHDFANGKAEVSPKDFPFTCTHCQQRLLCRLDIAALTSGDEESEPADAD